MSKSSCAVVREHRVRTNPPRTVTGRTSYFRVKDPKLFEQWLSSLPWQEVKVLTREDTQHGPLLAFGYRSECMEDSRSERGTPVRNLVAELANHLMRGWVAVWREVSIAGSFDLSGFAIAINAEGRVHMVDLELIYQSVDSLGHHLSPAED